MLKTDMTAPSAHLIVKVMLIYCRNSYISYLARLFRLCGCTYLALVYKKILIHAIARQLYVNSRSANLPAHPKVRPGRLLLACLIFARWETWGSNQHNCLWISVFLNINIWTYYRFPVCSFIALHIFGWLFCLFVLILYLKFFTSIKWDPYYLTYFRHYLYKLDYWGSK